MAWTTPATWTAGQVIGATDLNAQVRDNLSYLFSGRPLGTKVYVGAANYTTTSATFSDVDAANLILSLSSVSSGRIIALAALYGGSDNTASSAIEVDLILDSTTRAGHATHGLMRGVQNVSWGMFIIGYFSGVSVGSHTIKLQFRNVTAGATATIFANNFPIEMWALEV